MPSFSITQWILMHDWTILQFLGYNEYLFLIRVPFFFFLRFLASSGPAVTNVLIKYVQLSDLYKKAKNRESRLRMKMNKIGDGGIGERENHRYEIKNSKQEAYDSYINETVSDGISFVMILIYFFGQRWEFLSAKKKIFHSQQVFLLTVCFRIKW